MKKILGVILFGIFLLAGCSANDRKATESASDSGREYSAEEKASADYDYAGDGEAAPTQDDASSPASERMVMYNAQMIMAVEEVPQTISEIEQKTKSFQGYVVESSTYEYEKGINGHMTVRIPSGDLTAFLQQMEDMSDKVIQKTIEGQDVTEEYIDLESRLRAKRALETRLLDLLNQAETTEDLLKISDDLARVQEDIEQLEGRKKYIENRTDFAQVNLTIEDSSVYIPEVTKGEELQTGNKIKQAFANSINMIMGFFSGLLVFMIGYSPIFVLLGIPIVVIWFIMKKKNNHSSGSDDD
ncbi:hypothetical protein GCM10008967_12870 [Bacillus carboniphilus]|uniref:DUF4349 domain-containing protein n=1 Tax=Bacillus carboniphilus TaxID=86663 RepID=A0ABN0W322_9BACI